VKKPLCSIVLFAVALAAQTKSPAPDCGRKCLATMLDKYFDSVAKHKSSELPASSNVRVTENAVEIKFGEGLWQHGGPAKFRIDAIDPENGQIASMAVVTDRDKPALELVRLKIEKKKATEIETLVVRPGEGQRSNPENLALLKNPFPDSVAPAERATRQQLIAAAASYLDALAGGSDPYVPPPIAEDAFRAENGFQSTGVVRPGRPTVTLAESLRNPRSRGGRGLPAGSGIFGRRYPVVDVESGIVLAIGTMTLHIPPGVNDGPPGHINQPRAGGLRLQVLSEIFKVSGGQIRQIDAIMYDLDDEKLVDPGWPVTP
jgi:hypothetical protein